ncbi:oligosaccharide flippase family protein [Pseudoteredinibacter isoporae]|uniref:PST family polysaccharide transporter n=1 Tax=Pseudoteredinibacter isoporae TaxID=570281 RepID=A0A7X0MYG9_9GAMM|nr:oligosaccharide flippase family protein [Pseudoteredinibacter isoporae]MBB6523069.1 PST family polysaccharide transporter [Pseudoteredinibacter isoporae]NHO88589.1 oligosaccharide flippase family protein [Pseudoteredinibacter isoporae]NIB22720.1 oligosaccharide flippase family protein [Pseudoteredinibacter isoporae]
MDSQTLSSKRRFVHNLASLLGGEGAHRVSRLLSIMLIARALGVEEYGTMVFVGLCHETFRSLSRLAGGSLIIQCRDDDLKWMCENAGALNWGLALVTVILQCTLAELIAVYFEQPSVAFLLQVLSISHLLYPLVMVRVNLLHRHQALKKFALLSTLCVVVEDLSCALVAIYTENAWCVVVAKISSALLWCVLFYRYTEHDYPVKFDISHSLRLLKTSSRVFVSEICKQLRSSCDVFIAARVLGPEAFGLYSFARNAAIGIAQSLGNAYIHALYPHLTKLVQARQAGKGLLNAYGFALLISSLFFIQSLAAEFYVPLLFGEKWQAASTLVALLCFASVAILLLDTSLLFQRCLSRFTRELIIQASVLIGLCASLLYSDVRTADEFARTFVLSLAFLSIMVMSSSAISLLTLRHLGGRYEYE